MISGDTGVTAAWWWLWPYLADVLPALTVASVLAVLAVIGLINLAVSQSAPSDGDDQPRECAETIELPRRAGGRAGTIHVPGQAVMADAPTVLIERVSGR